MEIRGEFIFDATQERTWKAVQDPDVLASIMPGGEEFKEIGENTYSGLLHIKIGPVQGKFTGKIELSDIVAPESYNIQVDGKGSPGFIKANGSLKLTGRDGKTHMAYQGSAQVGGRIASVGQRLVETSAQSIIRQSLEGLNEYLKMQVKAEQPMEAAGRSAHEGAELQESAAAPAYSPPSQTEVALSVFKDVFNEIVPSQYRPVVFASFAALMILLMVRVFRK